MGLMLQAEQQSGDSAGQAPTQRDEGTDLPEEWTRKDLLALADRVYQLMLQDLLLERERGAW